MTLDYLWHLGLLLCIATTMLVIDPVLAIAQSPASKPVGEFYKMRGGLNNCRLRFERDKVGRVAFLGGSITEGGGWRDLVCQELRKRFPNTQFDFINAGISSMGSTPGAFRFSRDVLKNGPVDLLFEEAAVNDEANGQTDLEQIRGMEGIVRQARLANPVIDIVLLHFVDPAKMKVINRGQVPSVIANHEKIAAAYDLPSIDLAKEVTERIRASEFTWEKDFVDLHPSPFGHQLYYRSICRLMDAAWKTPLPANAKLLAHKLPDPVDAKSYFHGRLANIAEAQIENGWKLTPNWTPTDGAATRKGFVHVPMLVATEPGATLRLRFEGTAVGIFVAAGPDAGTVEYSVDGGPLRRRDLLTHWSGGQHLPWANVLAADLDEGSHELLLRPVRQKNPASTGHAVRIAHFLVNGPTPKGTATQPVNTAIVPVPKLEDDAYDWYARHAAVLEAKKHFDPQIVLIGDSITHFWGGDHPKENLQRGPKAWKNLFEGRRVLNLGFGWDRTQNVLWRLDHEEFDGLKPRYVVINIGTNNLTGTANARENTPAEIAEGIAEICKRIRAKSPDSRIILMGVFPRDHKADNPFRPKITAINELLAKYAKSQNITFLDIGPKLLQPDGSISTEVMNDGVHPTEKGYAIWAQALRNVMKW